MTKEVKIKGMSCGHCVKHVTDALSEVEGVSELQVNLEKANAVMQITDAVTDEKLIEAVEKAGYEVVEIR